MSLNLKIFFPAVSVFVILFGLSAFSVAKAEQSAAVATAKLRSNAKLHAPDDILADFVNGKPETAVIVVLQPSAASKALSDQSRLSTRVPAEFSAPGAPAYFDLRDESVRSQLRATVTETASRVIGRLGATGMTVTQRFSYQFGFAARVTPEALERIVHSADVITVEKDDILQPHLAQGISLMNAATVRSNFTGSGISIAICDTGIDTSHPMLGGGSFPNAKVIGGYDTGDNDADPRPNSVGGIAHGTACAGIAAGTTGAVGDYIGGVAPDAKLYALKISSGDTGSATDSAMIAAWEWCVTHKNDDPDNPIMIISTSFGGGRYYSTCDQLSALKTAAANAVAAGITIFASSGNNGYCDSMGKPACISYVNSVGAVYDGALGTLGFCVSSASCATKESYAGCSTGYVSWDFTAGDKVTSYSNSAPFLTLFAPSHNAHTTDIVGTGGYSTDDYNTSFGGTSAACPYAAGAAAVLQQAARAKTGAYLTPSQVRTSLVDNGNNLTDGKVAVTRPRIDLGMVVDALPASPVLTAEPAVTPGTGNTIYWSAVSGPPDISYYAECADNADFSAPVDSGWIAQTSTTFQDLTPGQSYWYRVKAESGTVESSWSNLELSQQESSGMIQFSAAAYSVNENGGSATITVTRTNGGNGAVEVSYITSDGTATAGSDYTATSGTLAWADGDMSGRSFTIPIADDSNPGEGNETVNLILQNATGGAILGSPSTAGLTILQTFTMTATADGGGSITPSSSVVVYGASHMLTLIPDNGYTLTGLTDNGAPATATPSPPDTFTYTIADVTTNHEIHATFSPISTVPALDRLGLLILTGSLAVMGMRKMIAN